MTKKNIRVFYQYILLKITRIEKKTYCYTVTNIYKISIENYKLAIFIISKGFSVNSNRRSLKISILPQIEAEMHSETDLCVLLFRNLFNFCSKEIVVRFRSVIIKEDG